MRIGRNREGYPDQTACEAIGHVSKSEKRKLYKRGHATYKIGSTVTIYETQLKDDGAGRASERIPVKVKVMQVTDYWIRVQYPQGWCRCFQWIDWKEALQK